jgi:hypothetical protein
VEAKCVSLTQTLIFFALCLFGFWKGGSLICIDVVVIWVVGAIDCLAAKLQGRFHAHDVMDNSGVVYPQYWL